MRHAFSIEEIKGMLVDRIDQVAAHYAPPASGSYTAFGKYYTLNPGRADHSVGSFYVQISGPKAGSWKDFAVGDVPGQGYGDVLDLIALSCNCDTAGALREARAFLGLATISPADAARRRDRERARRDEMRAMRKSEAEQVARRIKSAKALWLSGQEQLRGTPADLYLSQRRGISLASLGRQPGALRYGGQVFYKHIDPETGEVFEDRLPAMLAAVNHIEHGFVAVHRTYLGIDPADGRWNKARVPKAKKVYGNYAGAFIPISRGGDTGPRGGRAPTLKDCAPGTRLFITEGIEDALSCALLLPDERVVAAISLSNLGALVLPANVSDITIVADQDENEQARAALMRAVATYQQAGKTVRLWQNTHGGKDLNDALRGAVDPADEDEDA